MPAATQLSYVGVGKETFKGIGVVPTQFVPVKTLGPEDVVKNIPVEVFQGAMPKIYGFVQGYKNTTFEIGGPLFADMIGFPAFGVLGDITTTAQRTVNDGVTTSGSPTVTSATAAFTSADLGKNIGHANIPAGAVIQTVNSGTSVTMSQNSTATGASLTLLIGPPQWHVGNALNTGTGQPTSQTWTDFYGITQARQYAGIQWHEVGFKFSAEGLLEHTSKATGLVTSLQVAKPAQSFTAVTPTPAWTGVVTLAGTVVATIADGDLTITRTMELVPVMTGTQQYGNVWIGDISAKGKLVAVVNDDTELNRLTAGSVTSIDLNFSQGSGNTAQQFVAHMTTAKWLNVKKNLGKQWVAYDIDYEAYGNSTDVGASGGFGVCTLKAGNNIAAGTFI